MLRAIAARRRPLPDTDENPAQVFAFLAEALA